MNALPVASAHKRPAATAVMIAVFLVSTALIAYEIVLMRRLLIERWHHFGYLVISVALLGFGASGTLLAICARLVRRHPLTTLWLFALGLTASLVFMPRVAALLPVTVRFIPQDLWNQIGWWSLYWLAAGVPFLLGAALLGAALMTAGERVGRVYAVNLFGSGIGAVAGGLLVSRWPIEAGLWPSVALAALAALTLAFRLTRRAPLVATAVLLLAALTMEATRPIKLAPDEYKYLSYVRQLAAQGSAHRVARAADPHGYVEVYESKLFHGLPFLAISERPPPMFSILINGDAAGSALRITDVSQAAVMDRTLTTLPYVLVHAEPRVLLIGEAGGANVWLARRRAAREVVVVQPNAALMNLFRDAGPLADATGHAFDQPGVRVETSDPRQFLASKPTATFDLVQIVSLEGLGFGAAGMRGLAEDHLATVEGFAACLRALSENGVVAVTRGLQTPERENIRLLATFVEALERIGVRDAARHIVQVRDYLGLCTMILRAPLNEAQRDRLRATIDARGLTPVWYDGITIEEVNQPDALDGPPDTNIDWLYYAAREIFSDRREAFYRTWLTNVRPASDDSPFFWDFYKPGAVAELRRAYRDLWLTRAELGRLFLYASMVIAGAAAVVLILAPLAVAQRRIRTGEHGKPPTLSTIIYFAAIGLAFMAVEMALISRAIRSVGDPVVASAIVIGGILVASGLGSLTGTRWQRGVTWRPAAFVAVLATFATLVAWSAYGRQLWSLGGPTLLAILAPPLAYCMGLPMPTGLTALNRRAERLIPWAWGINGVASVLGTSLAIVVAMIAGYRYVLAAAAALYVVAALAALPLGRHGEPADEQ